jgi:translation initiation factor IF-2
LPQDFPGGSSQVWFFRFREPRLKIRIFALAKELDIDSKLLIDYCAKAGIVIKNSALASISPDEKDRVMDVIRSHTPVAVGAAAKPAAPSRELAPEIAGKVRTMRTMMSRPQAGRVRTAESEEPVEPAPPDEDQPVDETPDETVDPHSPPTDEAPAVAAETTAPETAEPPT